MPTINQMIADIDDELALIPLDSPADHGGRVLEYDPYEAVIYDLLQRRDRLTEQASINKGTNQCLKY